MPHVRSPHGTLARYTAGCRCEPCREAGREYRRIRRLDPIRQGLFLASQAKSRHKHKDKVHAYSHQRRKLAQGLIANAKARPCADCGIEYPPYVMDFDHRPGTHKISNVASFTRNRQTLAALWEEILKCDVVCANCHRERTHKRSQMNNLPPNVTGNEYEIAGPDYEQEREEECKNCGITDLQIVEGYHGQEWFYCFDCNARNELDRMETEPDLEPPQD